MERPERSSPNHGIASHKVICYAHRGARGHAPENTLLALSLWLLMWGPMPSNVMCSIVVTGTR